jgi:hypothetical protein
MVEQIDTSDFVPSVRLAQPSDEESIFTLWTQMHKEHSEPPFDEEKVRSLIRRFIHQQGGILGVVGESGDLKACICLTLDSVWFSNDYQLVCLFDFVRKDCRSGKLGLKRGLIAYAKETSDELGIEFMTGIFTNESARDNLEAKLRIYTSLLPKAGEFFRYSPNKKALAS